MNKCLSIVAALILSACAAPPVAAPTATPTDVPPTVTFTPLPPLTEADPNPAVRFAMPDAPAIEHGSGEWDTMLGYPVGMVYADGLYYLFRSAMGDESPEPDAVGYHTSPDGVTWTAHPANPVITTAAIMPAESPHFLPWDVQIEPDGTWTMIFTSWLGDDYAETWIGKATAPAPDGPWTITPHRWLPPDGSNNSIFYTIHPSITERPGGGFAMLAHAVRSFDDRTGNHFRWSTSDDGITWDQPVHVFEAGEQGTWDSGAIHMPYVVSTPDGYVMSYGAETIVFGGVRGFDGIGLALSRDGEMWLRHPANPVIAQATDLPTGYFGHGTKLAYVNDTYYLLLELLNPGGTSSDIWIATYKGSLLQ
jgi:hypothetical protein